MPTRLFRVVCLLACLMTTAAALAQEGHPLKGTWLGDWGPAKDNRTQVTIVLDWDGKNISGMINPGPDSLPIKVATLDSTKWTVHFEADGKDQSGNPVHFVADGKLDNIGSYHRTLTGTWNHGAVKGDFKITRD